MVFSVDKMYDGYIRVTFVGEVLLKFHFYLLKIVTKKHHVFDLDFDRS